MTALAHRPSHTVHPTTKRKHAASGPAHKAKVTRARRAAKGQPGASGARTQAMLQALSTGGPLSALGTEGVNLFTKSGRARVAGMGFHHKRQNPANVKALNRSLRRIEGFEKLVHRVMGHKLFKKVRGRAIHASHSGHKAGCGCAVCRRK
jgi:hypothetical protein